MTSLFKQTTTIGHLSLAKFDLEQDAAIIQEWTVQPYASFWGLEGEPVEKVKSTYQDILNLAIENEVEVATYIAPIRNDIKIPYKISEYETFKKEIENIAKKYKIYFTSLENLVPSEFWGTKASTSLKKQGEVDFMHFQAEGHRLLAEAVFLSISKILQLTKKP